MTSKLTGMDELPCQPRARGQQTKWDHQNGKHEPKHAHPPMKIHVPRCD